MMASSFWSPRREDPHGTAEEGFMANWEVDLSKNLEDYLQNYYRRNHWK
ncbi:unnamed protein product [Arabidopsis lyrata]|nr:unnamed protein product [Arabidopsis lyrata]